MKLALVYPPFFAKRFNENLPTVDDEFGLFPHLGFGWVARGARAAGWQVRLWDAPATRATLPQVLREVAAWDPDMVAFAAHACQTIHDMLSWAKAFKRELGLPTVVGGYEAKAYPEELLSHGCFDFLCGGEAQVVLPELLAAFERGRGYAKVTDLAWLERGRVRYGRPGEDVPFRDFPTPDRSIFPNHLYYSHVSQRRSFTIALSQLGCPYSCSFCCMRQSGFQARTAEQVVDEMEECRALGIREIDFFDPLMLHHRERVLAIARELRRRQLDVIWSCRSRVDSLSFHSSDRPPDAELIEALAEAGCRRIFFGIESGDDQVLRQMMKGQAATSHQERTLACVAEAGIRSLGFFILGAPGDTRDTVRKTVDLSLRLPLDYAQYQIAIIKPHTELERRHIIEGTGIDYWREYLRGRVGEHLLPSPWTELERQELEELARRAYLRFYARPGYALRMLERVESFEELWRYLRVGLQLALRPLRPRRPVSAARRPLRAARAFLEATLTAASPGARHAVFDRGGGLRGAWQLARDELRGVEEPRRLTPERARELKEILRRELGDQPPEPPAIVEARYVSRFRQPRCDEPAE